MNHTRSCWNDTSIALFARSRRDFEPGLHVEQFEVHSLCCLLLGCRVMEAQIECRAARRWPISSLHRCMPPACLSPRHHVGSSITRQPRCCSSRASRSGDRLLQIHQWNHGMRRMRMPLRVRIRYSQMLQIGTERCCCLTPLGELIQLSGEISRRLMAPREGASNTSSTSTTRTAACESLLLRSSSSSSCDHGRSELRLSIRQCDRMCALRSHAPLLLARLRE